MASHRFDPRHNLNMDTGLFYKYWGKARKPEDYEGEPYHLLVYHSLDVAAVANVLLERHPFLLKGLARAMDLPPAEARSWCVYLLGLHDLGKFAENFQQLRPDLRQAFLPDEKIRKTGYGIRHDSLGKILWDDCLRKHLLENGNKKGVGDK